MLLYHFACRHSATDIDADGGVLRPGIAWSRYDALLEERYGPGYVSGLAAAPAVVWLTSDPAPEPKALGLVLSPRAHGVTCDRMEYRYTVDTEQRGAHLDTGILPWRTCALLYLPRQEWRFNLEAGRDVDAWYVADGRVPTIDKQFHRTQEATP